MRGDEGATNYTHRAGSILVGGVIIAWAFLLFGYNDSYPWMSLVEVALGLGGIVVVATALARTDDDVPTWLGALALVLSCAAFFTWCWIQIRVAPSYGTDESAFDQYAAYLFTHGHNPYTSSMAPAFPMFHVSPDGFTFRLDGTAVTQLSYPALSFLIYVPFLLLGFTTQTAIVVNVAAWGATIVLSYLYLPRSLKPLAIVLGSYAIYTGFAVGGVTDAIYVPLLIVAVHAWDRWPRSRGWRRWLSPTMMALAMCVKQTPWFVLPFLLAGFVLETRAEGRTWKGSLRPALDYVGRLALVALFVNGYFIAIDPRAWLAGVFTPFVDHLVPAGEGLVAISDFMSVGGGSLSAYTFLVFAMALASMVVFVVAYRRVKGLMVFFPTIILFFASRSYSNYLVMLLAPALVAACSMTTASWTSRPGFLGRGARTARIALAVSLSLVAAGVVAVVVIAQPVSIQIRSVSTTGQLATVIDAQVSVTNRTSHSLTPVFSAQTGGALTVPWNVVSGPATLVAHETAYYDLQAPNFFAQPSLTGGFQIVALTTSPDAMSVSAPFTPTVWHLSIDPAAVNSPVATGDVVTIHAEVLGPDDNPIQVAGIPVYLGQVSYTQQGLIFSEAVINNSAEGATPVEAQTNSQGIATFAVSSSVASINPVYFEANLVNGSSQYPYGYSNIVPIRFH